MKNTHFSYLSLPSHFSLKENPAFRSVQHPDTDWLYEEQPYDVFLFFLINGYNIEKSNDCDVTEFAEMSGRLNCFIMPWRSRENNRLELIET